MSHFRFSMMVTLVLLVVACREQDPDSMSKAEARGLIEEGRTEVDLCDEHSWYGDGVCDDWCPMEDSDCEEPEYCAGIAGDECAEGFECVDDPRDDCVMDRDFDCLGICVEETIECAGFAGLECPEGLQCVDDPDDDCVLGRVPDCAGICVE